MIFFSRLFQDRGPGFCQVFRIVSSSIYIFFRTRSWGEKLSAGGVVDNSLSGWSFLVWLTRYIMVWKVGITSSVLQ